MEYIEVFSRETEKFIKDLEKFLQKRNFKGMLNFQNHEGVWGWDGENQYMKKVGVDESE